MGASQKDVKDNKRDYALKLAQAQAVSLVRAVEESDRAGRLLPLDLRQEATRAAREQAGKKADDPRRWLGSRAEQLLVALKQREPRLARILRATNVARGLILPVTFICLVLGLLTSALGPEQRFNVLAVPLLGLIVWNLVSLALMVGSRFLSGWKARERYEHPPFLAFLQHHAEKLVEKLPLKRRASESEKEEHELLQGALIDFLRSWLPSIRGLAASRMRRVFHTGALALVVGVVAGMYLRGIAFAYTATWESTFLNPGAVDAFLHFVLSPASWVSGLAIPRAELIQSPLQGPANQWIHLYAITAALFVGLPRGLLIVLESLRCAAAARKIKVELPEAYLRRLIASVQGGGQRVDILPYSYAPAAKSVENLKPRLYDLFGSKADLRLLASAEYGAEKEDLQLEPGRCLLVLFSLAQTPESEVHGELLQALTQDLPDGQVLLTLLDISVYKRRLESTTAEGRLAQRQRAWERVVREAGLEPVIVDLAEPLDDKALNRFAAAAWPQGVLAVSHIPS